MMKLTKLLERLEYKIVQGNDDIEITELTNDSRRVCAGSVFVCISGAVVDGHEFVKEVSEKGAKAVIVEKEVEAPEHVTVIKVEDTRYALALASAAYFGYPAEQLKVIGITGTKGKTTTTYLIRSILEGVGHKVGLIGTIEAIIGDRKIPAANTTPESFTIQQYFAQMVEEGCDSVVMEVSSQGLMLHRVSGFTFDYGIFTNIEPDHIGPNEHASFEEYLECKSMLFRQCKIGILNADDEHSEAVAANHTCEIHSFGVEDNNEKTFLGKPLDLVAADLGFIKENGKLGMHFHVKGCMDCEARVHIPGRFSVYNSLVTMLVCHLAGISDQAILDGLNKVQVKGRVEMLPVSKDYYLIIDYAHNEVSTRSVLTTLMEYHPKRLICVYGGGGNRSKLRRYDMGEVTGEMADLCVLTCDNPREEEIRDINNDIKVGLAKSNGKYIEIDDRKEAIAYCMVNAQPGDMIVLLGKGHEDYQEIRGVKYHFDERETVAEILEEIKEGKRVRTV